MSTAAVRLVARMLSFDSNAQPFDGYPGITDADISLVHEATAESRSDTSVQFSCPVILMSYLASEHVKTRAQYDNARAYIDEYVDNAWACNMIEGSNEVHDQINAAE
jgi:hypothetical protein